MTKIYVLPGDQPKPRFPVGELCITTPAGQILKPEAVAAGIARHSQGDWGNVSEGHRGLNEEALQNGDRLLSVYGGGAGTAFWIITEADRSVTTVLPPDDY